MSAFKGLILAMLIAVPIVLSSHAARAQKVDPRCAKMKDPAGCTCALENGGWIRPDGGWASAKSPNKARPTNQAFTDCMIRRGHR
jgi:hypothetical protein